MKPQLKVRCKYCNKELDDVLDQRHICNPNKSKWQTKKLGRKNKEPPRFMIAYRIIP